MRTDQAFGETARHGDLDVENASAFFAVEVVMRGHVAVVARSSVARRDFVHLPFGDENFEVAVHSPERERGHLGQQDLVNLRRRRMQIGGAQPFENSLTLTRAMTARRRRKIRGACVHARSIGAASGTDQAGIENSYWFLAGF